VSARERLEKPDRNKRHYWWFWLLWVIAFFVIEGYAIWTGEKRVPTLSRTIWWLRDRWKFIVIPLIVILFTWAMIHLAGGECFGGLC
jgi:uncharacterized membrane protein YhaH (DUF805 family)